LYATAVYTIVISSATLVSSDITADHVARLFRLLVYIHHSCFLTPKYCRNSDGVILNEGVKQIDFRPQTIQDSDVVTVECQSEHRIDIMSNGLLPVVKVRHRPNCVPALIILSRMSPGTFIWPELRNGPNCGSHWSRKSYKVFSFSGLCPLTRFSAPGPAGGSA